MKFIDYLDEAKTTNYKKAKIGGKVWMRIWKENPELQDEMLAFRKSKEAKFTKKLAKVRGLKEGELSESYFTPMIKIGKDMEKVLKELKRDKYLSAFAKEVEDAHKEWIRLTTKLA
jgi:5'-deoxynucleotidase YfbR-like HD superfamily hydrolase